MVKFMQTPRQSVFSERYIVGSNFRSAWLASINHHVRKPEMPPINLAGVLIYFACTNSCFGHGTPPGFPAKFPAGGKVPAAPLATTALALSGHSSRTRLCPLLE
jgi:hypothetical protein